MQESRNETAKFMADAKLAINSEIAKGQDEKTELAAIDPNAVDWDNPETWFAENGQQGSGLSQGEATLSVEAIKDALSDKLILGAKGAITPNRTNLTAIIDYLLGQGGKLYANTFAGTIETKGGLPWNSDTEERDWATEDDSALKTLLEGLGLARISNAAYDDAIHNVCRMHKRHPIRECLESLTWDGIERVDDLLHKYLGANDSPYTRAVMRKTLVGAIKRAYEPGCKFDYILTLAGEQGKRKSLFWAILGGKWFSDSVIDFRNTKQAQEKIQGVWIQEIPDLAGLDRMDAETMKGFFTSLKDRYRPAYERRPSDHPRQMIFVASTNKDAFLKSQHGERRWWVASIDECNRAFADAEQMAEALRAERDQIWAEAMHYYRQGEKVYLDSALEREAKRVQDTFNLAAIDPLRTEIEEWLAKPILEPQYWRKMSKEQRRDYYNIPTGISGYHVRWQAIFEEFENEWVRPRGIRGDSRDLKKRFSAILKNLGWIEKPYKYPPYFPQSHRVFTLESAKGKTCIDSDLGI